MGWLAGQDPARASCRTQAENNNQEASEDE